MPFSNQYTLLVDIKKRLSSDVPTFKQGDNGVLKFEIYDNGRKYDLTDYTYSEITFRLPSGNSIVGNPVLGVDGVLTYNFTGVEMSEVGKIETVLSIYSGSQMVSIQPFTCFIYDSMKGEDLSYIGILQDLIAEVQILRTEVTETVAELNDTLDEANRIKNEVTDLNNTVITQEQIRESDEEERKSNEITRISNESSRQFEEQKRVQNEQIRNANEQNRLESLDDMNTIINQFKTTGTYMTNVTYKKFNQVEFEGSTYIALVNNTNIPVSDTNTWRIFAQKGLKGDKGDTGASLSILGKLTGESQLPPTGQAGDAYTVNGELYVWSEITNSWENVGNIKGEKGDVGVTGENGKSAYEVAVDNGFVGTSEEWLTSLKGEKGDTPDLTEITQTVLNLQQTVTDNKTEATAHLAEMKPKVDNSWQKNAWNDTSVTNLEFMSTTKTMHFNDWDADNSKLDAVYINIPVATFSGLIKLSMYSTYHFGNAMGGVEVTYQVAKINETMYLNSKNIENISPEFANCFYIGDMVGQENRIFIPITKAPTTRNALSIKIELFSMGDTFKMIEGMSMSRDALVSQSHPWTPQTALGDKISQSLTRLMHPNFDELLEPGTYAIGDTEVVPGAWGTLVVYKSGDVVHQIVLSLNNNMSIRTMSSISGTKTPWTRILNQDDYDRLFTLFGDKNTKIASAITDMGVPTSADATSEQMASNIRLLGNLKEARGIVDAVNGIATVRGLGFKPISIICKAEGVTDPKMGFATYIHENDIHGWSGVQAYVSSWDRNSIQSSATIYNDGFTLQVDDTNKSGRFGYYAVGKTV